MYLVHVKEIKTSGPAVAECTKSLQTLCDHFNAYINGYLMPLYCIVVYVCGLYVMHKLHEYKNEKSNLCITYNQNDNTYA